MRRILTIVLLVGICKLGHGADESQEPPLQYTLEIDGRPHDLSLDKPVRIEGTFKDPRVVLKASSVRQFNHGDVEFQYPASFSWEAELESPGSKTWTLSGNDFKILYFVQAGSLSAESFARAFLERIEDKGASIADTTRMLGDREYKGKRLAVRVAGVTMRMEAYALASKSGSRLIVFQDCPKKEQTHSDEGEKTLSMLTRSFKDKLATDKPQSVEGK